MSARKRKWDVVCREDQPRDEEKMKERSSEMVYEKEGDTFEKEIEINDCPPNVRYQLCRSGTHDQIASEFSVSVKVRGKFHQNPSSSLERGLYLHLSSFSKEGLESAMERIVSIMNIGSQQSQKQEPSKNTLQNVEILIPAKVSVGLVEREGFPLKEKLEGKDGVNFQHIQKNSGCNIVLRGQGSQNPDDMHLYITGPQRDYVDKAKSLAEDLVSAIQSQYYDKFPPQPQPQVSYESYYSQYPEYAAYYSYPYSSYYSQQMVAPSFEQTQTSSHQPSFVSQQIPPPPPPSNVPPPPSHPPPPATKPPPPPPKD